jgi:hypothetical protein
MGFESFENLAALRMVKASLSTKLSTLSADPMIDGALKVLTNYSGISSLTLSFIQFGALPVDCLATTDAFERPIIALFLSYRCK